MKKLYIFNYTEEVGTREQIKAWLGQEEKITNWRYDMPGCFYLVSDATANELSQSFIMFNGTKGRHLIAEINDNRQGLLPKQTWTFMRHRGPNMEKLTADDLLYKDEYVDTAEAAFDDPKIISSDNKRFNRKEKYEILYFLNSLTGKDNGPLSQRSRRVCEWMIHEHLPADIQGTNEVKKWVVENYPELSKDYPFES
ncbi:hypothetical protein ACPEEE_00865 [Klebsiella pneumoniae]|nr:MULTISPECIES: hypothetical protein [Klebsiella]MCF2835169.1 hypothetical protein [Klebsiella pneumoniae]MCF6946129.1 hypothetical protein [Klebsiella pneumoniae]MCF7028024.1 hypothetical protein [Klebsiella pneumoniae]MCF7133707.1 hypothetical protein [Klebsiella pneumoniae]MCF7139056.1 hypothetical protein [Klebsiella pneumoniae]